MTTYAPVTYTVAGGSLRGPFDFSFTYLEDEHIGVKINDAEILASEFTIETSPNTRVRLNNDAVAGDIVVVFRESDIENRLVDWQDASVITEATLDYADDQLYNLIQEAYSAGFGSLTQTGEGNWDAQGYRIINVGDCLANKDAANKDYVDAQVLYGGAAVPQQWEFVSVSGAETQVTLTNPTPAALDPRFYIVTVDGVTQEPNSDYYLSTSGGDDVLIFNTPSPLTAVGQRVVIRNFGNARSILGNPVQPATASLPALALQGITGQTEYLFEVYDIGDDTTTTFWIDKDGNASVQDLTVVGSLTATIAGGTFTGDVTGDLTGDVLAADGAIIVDSGADLANSVVKCNLEGNLLEVGGTADGVFLANCRIAGDSLGNPGILQVAPYSTNGLTGATVLTGPNAGDNVGGRMYFDTEGPVLVGGSFGTLGTNNGCSLGVTVDDVYVDTNGGVGSFEIQGGGDLDILNGGNLLVSGVATQTGDGTADDDLLRKEQVEALVGQVTSVTDITESISSLVAGSAAVTNGNVATTLLDTIASAPVIENTRDGLITLTGWVDASDTNTGTIGIQISADGSTGWITIFDWSKGGGSGHDYNTAFSFDVPSGWFFRVGSSGSSVNTVRQLLRYVYI